ncbi:BTAD domain-containing putative transcriptional regulator [Streptomyces sp. NPDC047315]|uniref:BTAD domain-containing putative transcriptional regulator n=1 Tax=Streptomyces sp. NPDC047315 TaxID=3155142 RepID=UPI0033DCB2AD
MRYSLLGTTEVHDDDGAPVAIGGARLRSLLAVLALRAGRAVPVAVLVDEVWDGDPPADATGALQALVGRLRRTIGADAVLSDGGGYRLGADHDDVDLHRFTRLAGEGRRALDDGDAAKALDVLDDALGLWRGPALADLPDGGAEAARLEARRLEAVRTRLTALTALGRAEETLPELADLCAAHPLDEPLHALHVRALRAAGRPARALDAYETLRRSLAERLGTDPGPELIALHRELLAPAEPSPAPVRAPVPNNPVRAPRGNLRARLTSFVGREDDIADLRDDLQRARLVTLLGPGGSGKTRLSQEAGERVAADHPDGVWLVELAPVNDPETVPEAVLAALGARGPVLRGAGAEEMRVAEGTGDEPLRRLVELCARRRMLLIVDNCEHVVGTTAALVERLLGDCPGVTVLATSREPLGVPGEVVRAVDPLPQEVALRLLADRGAAARPGFSVADDPEACAEICRRLDGLPLAVELAAARLRALAPRQIADRLDDRFRLLTSGSRTVLPRQQTLRAVVDWSWDLLDEAERTVLRRLSVFAGGCALSAAEAVCGQELPAAGDVLDVLAALVDKSLVVAVPDEAAGMRYRLLETVAEYAAERLDQSGERAPVERRHLVHHRELARATDPLLRGPDQHVALALLDVEYENLRTALRRAVAAREEQEVLSLVMSLTWYWQMKDLRTETRHWTVAARELGPDPFGPDCGPAEPVHERPTDLPPPWPAHLLDEARRSNDMMRMVVINRDMEVWTSPHGLDRLRRVTRVYHAGLPQICRHPASMWFFAVLLTGDLEALKKVLNDTVRTSRSLPGYDWELASALETRANVLANRTRWAGDAIRDADEALEIFQRLGDSWGEAESLAARAEARERRGDYADAADDYAAAVARAERIGAHGQVAVLRARLGGALMELGPEEGARGEAILREVVDGQDVEFHEASAVARIVLGLWLGRTGRIAESRELMTEMLGQFQASMLVAFEDMVRGFLAWLDHLDGHHERALAGARRALEGALTPLCRAVAPHMIAPQLVTAAGALSALHPERAADAARILGAADAQRMADYAMPRHEAEQHEQVEARLRALLKEAYPAAYAEGDGLSAEEAVALV